MALMSCPECKKEISDQAAYCPNCGYCLNSKSPQEKQESKKTLLMVLAIVVACALAAFVYDACTVSLEEQVEIANQAKQKMLDSQKRVDDLERELAWNQFLMEQYSK